VTLEGLQYIHSRYNNDPRTLPQGAPALTEERFVYSVSTFTKKFLLYKEDKDKEIIERK
jgi:hypothetical protein